MFSVLADLRLCRGRAVQPRSPVPPRLSDDGSIPSSVPTTRPSVANSIRKSKEGVSHVTHPSPCGSFRAR
jgi:hypothetical protein